jgi:multicomponent Na+:H+ antiporter subunit G
MTTVIGLCLAIVGATFLLLAGVGILRLPDVFCRASATTKAATLGVGCVLVSAAIYFGDLRVTTRVLATIAFLLLTAPVAAHMIARAAYFQGVPLWSGTVRDELKSHRSS